MALVEAIVIFKSDTLANWTSTNPVIPASALVLEVTIGGVPQKAKLGDGVTAYLSLPYAFIIGGGAGSQDLQSVLNLGNTVDSTSGGVNYITLIDTSLGIQSQLAPYAFVLQNTVLSNDCVEISYDSTSFLSQINIRDKTTGSIKIIDINNNSLDTGKISLLNGSNSDRIDLIGTGFISIVSSSDVSVTSGSQFSTVNSSGTITKNGIVKNDRISFSYIDSSNATNNQWIIEAPSPTASQTFVETITVPQKQSGVLVLNNGANIAQTLSAATTATVTHSLGFSPQRIFLQPRNLFSGTAITGSYISSITITNFVITFASPQTGNFNCDWQAF